VATKKIQKVLEKLKDIPKEAEVELKTLAQLKGRISELEAKLREQPKPPKPEVIIQKIDEKVIRNELIKQFDASIKKVLKDTTASVIKSLESEKAYQLQKIENIKKCWT